MRFFGLSLALVSLLISAHAQSLTPPRGWSISSEQGFLILKPETIKSGQELSIQIFDPEPAKDSLAPWLKNRLMVAKVPDAIRNGCTIKIINATLVSCDVREPDAHHHYYGFQTPQGEHRFLHVLTKPTLLTAAPYLQSMNQIFNSAQAGLGRSAGSTPNTVATTPQPAQPRAQTPVATTGVPAGSAFTLPIEGIYLHLEYQAGVGGGIYPVYEPYILFKDGVITDDLSYYPKSNADLEGWRARKPRAWGRWSKTGGALSIRWDDAKRKPETWNKWFVAQPGVRGSSLAGRYQSISGGGNTAFGGDVMIAAWSNYQFSSDGGFTAGGGSGSSSGGGGTGVSVATSSKRPSQQGRYSVQGFSITFDHGDGRRETQWFYRYPKSEKDPKSNEDDRVIGVGSRTLTIRD